MLCSLRTESVLQHIGCQAWGTERVERVSAVCGLNTHVGVEKIPFDVYHWHHALKMYHQSRHPIYVIVVPTYLQLGLLWARLPTVHRSP